LLKIVKKALEEIKDEDKDIEKIDDKQARSIGVIYNDNFQIDVVPAIQIEKDKCYKIFDKRTQNPVESNPKLHSENLTEANETSSSGSVKRLVPIVKLLKTWKREKCDYVKSFHLEMLAVEILGDQKIQSFSEGVTKFFINAGDFIKSPGLADPANKENCIDEYLDSDGTRDKLNDLVVGEKAIAEKAVKLESNGEDEKAVKEWKKMFEPGNDKGDDSRDYPQKDGPVIIKKSPAQPWCNVSFDNNRK